MKPSQVQTHLISAIQANHNHPPIFISGPPGVGKSSVVRDVAEALHAHLCDCRAALYDPTDFRGIPIPKDGKAFWLPPSFLPPSDSPDLWVLFLDELNLAPLLVQHAAYQLILDRRVGEYTLPERCFVIAAGNRVEDRTGVRDMPAALANRFEHIAFDLDVAEWSAWAIKHGVSGEVVAFIRLYSDMLFAFDPQRDKAAYPTPRTVVFADRVWKTHENETSVWEAIAGCTGKEWSAKFHAFIKLKDQLPNVDDILAGKSRKIPDRSDLLYAIAALLGSRATEGQLEHAVSYANLLPAEHGAFLVQLLATRLASALAKTKALGEWVKQHRDFILDE